MSVSPRIGLTALRAAVGAFPVNRLALLRSLANFISIWLHRGQLEPCIWSVCVCCEAASGQRHRTLGHKENTTLIFS